MTYAFVFDASACSGCKACQIACKDKNNLPLGVLWRRVYEITGGTWQRIGEAWVTDVFAYNLSIACNHCVHPKCAGVCPTDAYVVRKDGIVYIDASKCIGCGYCAWACPYAAPQFNWESGVMTKCNFCYDNIDAGIPPACVAACPVRVLDFISIPPLPGLDTAKNAPTRPPGEGQGEAPQRGVRALWQIPATEHPFPLPDYSRTEPHLAVKPHAGMVNGLEKVVANREEIRPIREKSKIRRFWSPKSPDFGFNELPLVAFTLLNQMAAGMALFSFFSGPLAASSLFAIGGLIGASGLAALLHLGAPLNAWRAAIHLRKSWLSREILMFTLFGASWLASLAMPGMGKLPLVLSGTGLVYSMAQVYRLRSMPAWNTNRTLFAFVTSALLLGLFGLKVLDLFARAASAGFPRPAPVALIGLAGAFLMSLTDRNQAHQTARSLRLGLIGLGIVGAAFISIPNGVGDWLAVPVFISIFAEEGIGRWLFYEHLGQRNL